MKNRTVYSAVLISTLLLVSSCGAQPARIDRQPAVAGQFYPASKEELQQMLGVLFAHAEPSHHLKDLAAIIVPHAGYVFSGEVAASGYAQIDPEASYENIFVIGPSHHVGFEGAAVYTTGDYLTPLGRVKVNSELAKELVKTSPLFSNRTDAQESEHSVEVQLPFLQYRLHKSFAIVPIVIGSGSPETCDKIAEVLRPYFKGKNLFVVSTDFSHYPSYDDANRVDRRTGDAVISNSADVLLRTLQQNDDMHVPDLVTSMCGWAGVLTLLDITQSTPGLSFEPIRYRNSGDAQVGDRQRVVGYYAIAVSRKAARSEEEYSLPDSDKRQLLTLARDAIEKYVRDDNVPDVNVKTLGPALLKKSGAFVTLQERGELRGCIGRFDAYEPLWSIVQQMAVAAATEDYRFSRVEPREIPELEIEISVLTPMRRIQSIDEFQLGKQGIYIKKGNHGGTFLPQVAAETGWSKEEFLGHCAQDKAGLTWDGWKDAELYVYEAYVFGEKDFRK